jgi:uridine kinase
VSARTVLDLARARPTTLGEGRLICVDGPSGSGKTTFAAQIADLAADACVVHVDDLLDGWDGLPRVTDQLRTLLTTVGSGHRAEYRRYDWVADRYAEAVGVAPGPLLVLEGVGSWAPSYASLVTALVWLEAPTDVRLARVLRRDGAEVEQQMQGWLVAEAGHLSGTGARDHADMVLGT